MGGWVGLDFRDEALSVVEFLLDASSSAPTRRAQCGNRNKQRKEEGKSCK